MNQRTTIEAMQAVLNCKKIGQAAAIYAVQAIANEYESKFQEEIAVMVQGGKPIEHERTP